MDDAGKKGERNKQLSGYEKWVEKLAPKPGQTPTGVSTFVGLLRQSPSDPDAYELFQTLDMGSSLQIRKEDVVHLEDLASDKSPFGALGGSRVYVRVGATITSLRTSTSTFTAGASAPDDFDLDIRLGARPALRSDLSANHSGDRVRSRVRHHSSIHRSRCLSDRSADARGKLPDHRLYSDQGGGIDLLLRSLHTALPNREHV